MSKQMPTHIFTGNTFLPIIYMILDTMDKENILETRALGYVIDIGCKIQHTNM